MRQNNVGGVTAGQAPHNSSNVGVVTTGQVGHNLDVVDEIEYDVTYNSTKSNVIVFRGKLLKNVHVPEFVINNTAIDRVYMYIYLGHCLNDELSDDDDMTRQRSKVYAQGNALIRKFDRCTENIKIALFKSYCTTLYSSTMWRKYPRESLRKLCVAYNNIFRRLTHQAGDCNASHMFVSRQLTTCKILIRRIVYGFISNVHKSNNLIRNSIVHCIVHISSVETLDTVRAYLYY